MSIDTNRREVALRWTGEGFILEGTTSSGAPVLLDGNSVRGPSPMEGLLSALAGCMAVDIQAILEKSRVPLEELEVRVVGERAPEPPKRFTRIRMVFGLKGPSEADEGKVLRAIQLSEEKYCSVHHTLRSDMEIQTVYEKL
ncbi:MAG: OsmC family peroxiredoxin [Gemmatimonadales bacterium]|nr:MAG: OsmC family peroxiredoxin [Gemmatimonadales bacterium]